MGHPVKQWTSFLHHISNLKKKGGETGGKAILEFKRLNRYDQAQFVDLYWVLVESSIKDILGAFRGMWIWRNSMIMNG